MAKIFQITDEYDERSYSRKGSHEYKDEDHYLEKAFKEGCEHGYKKAMREMEEYNERGGRMNSRIQYKEGFEEKIEKLKEKYK